MTLPLRLNRARDADRAGADAELPTTRLFTDLLTHASRRGEPMRQALQVGRIKQLIDACAWTDAALALVALQSPQWKLRRLAYDGGAWHCALSRQRDLPEWLDQDVETHHPDMAMAIVRALVEADRALPPSHLAAVPTGQPDQSGELLLCDSFA